MIAIQGPLSQQITQRFTKGDLASVKYYGWIDTRSAASR
jgi:glycine cleavage system aminomethyltransferase T